MTYTVAMRTEHTDVMVVDPHPEDYAQLAAAHASRGMLFQFATTASDALRLWRTGARSIWLVNVELPDAAGVDLAAALRARDPQSAVYIVGDEYDTAEEIAVRMAGVAMYLCKPADPCWLELATGPRERLAQSA